MCQQQQQQCDEPSELELGSVVKIGGLVSAQEHNGKLGLVEGFDAVTGRCIVRLSGEAVTMNLKTANVQRVPVRPATSAA
eukprot:COSAG01_NODE_7692_length_3096_cov_54.672339_2_plen_80_part_00